MRLLQTAPSLPEDTFVRSAPAPLEIACGLNLGEVMISLMRLRPRTRNRGDLEVILKRLVEDTRLLFRASGAAVAIRGDGDICRWRAKCGETGPQIGVPLNPLAGISAECLASGRVQFCRDTLSDARFDAELCRQLRLRSMIVAPIRSPERVEGILEAWSSHALAFDGDCVEILRKLADFSGRVTGLGRGFEERSAGALLPAFAHAMTSAGRGAIERARDFVASMQGRTSGAPADFAPVSMRLRARGILIGLALSTVVGAVWYSRPAIAGSFPARPPSHHLIRTGAASGALDIPVASPLPVKPLPVQRISQGLTGGQLLSSVRPVYPSAAIEKEIEGTVVLQARVDEGGRVEEVSVMKGQPLLASAAVTALKRWHYKPFLLNNRPVPVIAQIDVNFKLE